ncbi:MAG: hypothetical protein ACYC96_05450 [Fimbriimonadaceae bacterium]
MSSHGRAQRSGKSINLEANILAEWSGASVALQQRIRLRTIALVVILAVGAILLPQLDRLGKRASAAVVAARARNGKSARAAAEWDRRTRAEQPLVQEADMLAASKANVDTLLGNITLVVNAVPTSVTFDVLHAEVVDAELTITCKSQAESNAAGQQFVDAASQGPNVVYAVQASTMKSNVLAEDGVAFDFIKRVNLEP